MMSFLRMNGNWTPTTMVKTEPKTNGIIKATGTIPVENSTWKRGKFGKHTYNFMSLKPTDPSKATFLLLHGFPNGKL